MTRGLRLKNHLLMRRCLVAKPVVEDSVFLLRVAEVNGLGVALTLDKQLQVGHLLHACYSAGDQVRCSAKPAKKPVSLQFFHLYDNHLKTPVLAALHLSAPGWNVWQLEVENL